MEPILDETQLNFWMINSGPDQNQHCYEGFPMFMNPVLAILLLSVKSNMTYYVKMVQ
jgi:hypothetical protein